MKKYRNSIFYIVAIGCSSILMYGTVLLSARIEQGRNVVIPSTGQNQWANFVDSLRHNIEHPLAILLAQIVTIIIVARFFGWVFKKIGQPTVIGEIIAGILLGPSLFGMYFPEFSMALFPAESLGNLQFLSQIGLILFMFIVGMELDLKFLKSKAYEAVVISHTSIFFPFALGMVLAYFIYDQFAPQGVQFLAFGLFIGIAMSITAFPILARIVQERGLNKTRLGTIVITCAAADDLSAWCILAAVIAIVKAGSFVSALYVIGMSIGYVFIMIKVVKPFLKQVGNLHSTRENMSKPIVSIFFITLIISSYTTEIIGIHALFGAFMAGMIMPESAKFRNIFIEKLEDVSIVLLLPLFFVYTGLRTEIGLLNDVYLWKITGLIVLVAVIGKFVGSALAAKFVGQGWKDSLTIGALMNTRGLMELVVLNIGYDLGVLTPEIFAMMVIMALATTVMTGPALNSINWLFKSQIIKKEINETDKYKVLISFGNPERGKTLLRLANGLTKKHRENASITAMHLTLSNEINQYNVKQYEEDSFVPIIQESELLNQKITTLYKASSDIDGDIIEVANRGNFDLLLIGVGQSIYEGSLLGKILGFTTRIVSPGKLLDQVKGKENLFEKSAFDNRTKTILSKSAISVGVMIDKNFQKVDHVLLPIFTEKDMTLIHFAQRLIQNSSSEITILDMANVIKNSEIQDYLGEIEQIAPNHLLFIHDQHIAKDLLLKYDLMILSADSWKKQVETKSLWLSDIPSTLVLFNAN